MAGKFLLFAVTITLTLFTAFVHDAVGRESWEGSISGSPDPPLPFKLTRVYPELTFNQPVVVTRGPNDKRLYVLEPQPAAEHSGHRRAMQTLRH
jgi:hypothetical protein